MTTAPEVRPTLAPLIAHLASFGERRALVTAEETVTYADLARRVERAAAAFAGARRLVLVTPGNDVDSVVEYVAALAADQAVLVSSPAAAPGLAEAYAPDVVVGRDGPEPRSEGSRHDLHPDLALLLSTSGSTGSPKLVRLARDGVLANAAGIAETLGIRDTDLAATTLPLHYCYGLSVLHSHLLRGAGVLLTELSVVDECFWDLVREHGVTTIPGVPHTFELLERAGFADRDVPSVRALTQAGGRMDPTRVRAFAELGQRRGFDLFVMYGATEATARMSVLPPDLAPVAPGSIGRPLPGTSFELAPVDHAEPGVGELVFSGPNVMMGYAESPAELAAGRTVEVLRTGDLGRQRSDGLWEVVGRISRTAKVCGLRIDLDRVERSLALSGTVAAVADAGDRIVVGVVDGARPVDEVVVRNAAAEAAGIAPTGAEVVVLPDLPRLANGKVDHRALVALVRDADAPTPAPATPDAVSADCVAALLGSLLGRPDARPTDSFVTLGGDSLSYVEVSLRLEALLGHLPQGWPAMPATALADAVPSRRRRGVLVETNVVLRALAIVTIVGSHANLFTLLGGAHVLLAIVGFNLGRFQLGDRSRRERTRAILRGVARVVVPSVLVIGTVAAFSRDITWKQALLLTAFTEWSWSEPRWSYWFIEALTLAVLVLAGLLALPFVDRATRRHPFGTPVVLTLVLLPTRYDLVGMPGDHVHRAHGVLWLLTLGWAMSQARTTGQRLIVSALAVALVPGFFSVGGLDRHLYVALGLLALAWVPQVRLPAVVAPVVGALAASSLWIYLLHWRVYPRFEVEWPLLATLLSLAVGVLAASVVRRTGQAWRQREDRARHPRRESLTP
ncbi:AMP-binding protein [Nocardioides sediminis]|uniref:AMP-binding protein n=1 Tax=Nocardioides sediminis TaxID=433648 RepID=UPI000D3209A8|nr:AMP-binding protein [Nocardioides sediminis]